MNKPTNLNTTFRTIAMTLLVVGIAVIWYIYHYILIFNDTCHGKIYGDNIFKGGRYEVKSLKYYYQHNGFIYFDSMDEIVVNEYETGDSLKISALSFYPSKHRIIEVHRDLTQRFSYNPEDGFITQYHMHISKFEDYYGSNNQLFTSPEGNAYYYSTKQNTSNAKNIGIILDKIKFNQGSLIESSIIRENKDSLIVKQVYFYLNNFSLDAEPSKALRQELKKTFPNKTLKLSVLDKSNPKHERILK